MAHVPPRLADEVPFLQPVLESTRRQLGFAPNSLLTMAHLPHAALAFGLLMSAIRGGDLRSAWKLIADHVPPPEDSALNVEPALLQLAAFAVSVGAGCRYCQAHTAHTQETMTDLSAAKVADLLRYEHSPHYSPRERVVVALALAAAEMPNTAEPRHFAAMREHFSNRQIVQIVSTLSLFGFLNRWNDTMATTLEDAPLNFAAKSLGSLCWVPGKHGSDARSGGDVGASSNADSA
jgi:alkylhydroperoxidase family enzyme